MSKKLFDEENEHIEEPESTSYLEELQVYIDEDDGTGFQRFGKFAVDSDWMEKNNRESRNSYEEYEMKLLEEDLYKIYKNSPFAEKYEGNKKVPKHELVYVYLYFIDRLENPHRYTAVEKYLAIVGFMKMNYETMYRELPIVYKEEILKELNKKYHVISKDKRSHKLF